MARTREHLKSGRGIGPQASAKVLDLDVEPRTLQRALRIMDALLKALEERNLPVRITDDEEPKTIVEVHGVELPIRLEEKRRRVEVPQSDLVGWRMHLREDDKVPTRYEHEPTGMLALKIDVSAGAVPSVRKTWADGKTQRVEELLNRFVVGLVRAAEVKKRRDSERAERQRQWERRRERERQRRQRAEREQKRREDLADGARRWIEHRQLREYVEAVRRRAQRRGLLGTGSEIGESLKWAESYLERTDPLDGLEELSVQPGNGNRTTIFAPEWDG